MICARYARLSKKGKRNEDKAASIERQLGDAERFVLEHNLGGVVESAVYAEPEGTSGAAYGKRRDGVSRRPAWDAMMADAQAKKFKSVVMMTPDRGSREMFRGGAAFFDLFETGCAIYFYDRGPEPLDLSDPTKKLMFQIELFGGEFYRSSGKFKTTRAMQDLARNGFSTGHRIYGYRSVPTTQDPKKKLSKYEVVPERAAIVRRIFEESASGVGDLKIATTLNKQGILGPRSTWAKEIIRLMLRNPMYAGTFIHGRTKAVDKGGDTTLRVDVPEDDWIKTTLPELQIVPTELWEAVRARKKATAQRYGMRKADGTLLGKPESGLLAKSLLAGFLRCSVCGGSMTHMSKRNHTRRYYCVERSRRGPSVCANAGGVPIADLDKNVLAALHKALNDEQVVWDLCTERAARWRRENTRPANERANSERQVKRLEGELANLTRQAARGVDIDVQEFNQRRAQAEALKAKLTEPTEIRLDRETLKVGLKVIRQFHGGRYRLIDDPSNDHILVESDPTVGPLANADDPIGVRSALRKVGVQRIICKPVADGWDFDGLADLGRLVNNKGVSGPPYPPVRVAIEPEARSFQRS